MPTFDQCAKEMEQDISNLVRNHVAYIPKNYRKKETLAKIDQMIKEIQPEKPKPEPVKVTVTTSKSLLPDL